MENKILRIKLHQNKAHYRKEESVTNKMTYPLPPYSTVIGAIHNACGYDKYHDMDISIQGKYDSMDKEVYKDQAFLNSTMDDRGILVKLKNPKLYNEGYKVVARALCATGNSFKNNQTIGIDDYEEYDNYIKLCSLREEYDMEKKNNKAALDIIKSEIKKLKDEKKQYKKNSPEEKTVSEKISVLENEKKQTESEYKKRRGENVDIPLSYYASLTTSIRYYEVLYNIDLVIHIRSDEKTVDDILKNINNMTSIGRSEDFIDIEEIKVVDVTDDEEKIDELDQTESYSMYISKDALKRQVIDNLSVIKKVDSIYANGTVYRINKDYKIVDKKRIFNKKKVAYISNPYIEADVIKKYNSNFSKLKIGLDEDGYIVSFE